MGGLHRKMLAWIFHVCRLDFGERRALYALDVDIQDGLYDRPDDERHELYSECRRRGRMNYVAAESMLLVLATRPLVFYLFPIAVLALVFGGIHELFVFFLS